MDKAKAYDEALERARKMLNMILDNKLLGFPDQIREIFPQLRESNDERIREELIEYHKRQFENNRDQEVGLFHKDAIAYLEKQKEETENATKTLAKILEDSAEGFRRILKKKGIDYEVSDKFWENEAGVYSKEENVKFHKWMDDLMGPTPIEETNAYKKGLEAGMKQKEQKPIEPECPQFVFDDILALECAMGIVYRKGDEQKLYEALMSLHSRLHDMIDAQKEQESTPNTYGCLNCTKWEECKKGLTPCSGHRLKIVDQKPADDKAFEEWIDSWFKEHKEKAYPQITMDEKEFKNFCRGIRNMYQQKSDWNEEDEEIWFALVTFFKGYLQKYPPACKDEKIQANRILKWLNTTIKSFRLHHRYKPTEEQMKALKNSAYGTYQNGDGPALRELYEQLLKLGVKEEPEYYQHFDPDC